MKKAKSRLEAAAEFLKTSPPSLVMIPGEVEGETDKVLMLGDGEMIWLASTGGPDNPIVSIDALMADKDNSFVIMDLFVGEVDENLTATKLYKFETELRRVLKTFTNLSEEQIREIKIKFMDAKESVLCGDDKDLDSEVE